MKLETVRLKMIKETTITMIAWIITNSLYILMFGKSAFNSTFEFFTTVFLSSIAWQLDKAVVLKVKGE